VWRGSLAYIFSGVLIWVQYVKSISTENVSFLYTAGKGSETFFRLILSEKNRFPTEAIHQLSISEVKMLLLSGKIGKAYKVLNFFVYTIDEIPDIFSNSEAGAKPKLAHAYYVFRSEVENRFLLSVSNQRYEE